MMEKAEKLWKDGESTRRQSRYSVISMIREVV